MMASLPGAAIEVAEGTDCMARRCAVAGVQDSAGAAREVIEPAVDPNSNVDQD